jgi:serine protease
MATPAVAGVAALMLSVNRKLTPDQVAALLKSSARAFPGACAKCGAGIVDANAAVSLALAAASAPTPAPTPAPVVVPTPAPAPVPAAVAETEPNDTLANAQVVGVLPATLSGAMGSNTDLDHIKGTVAAGKTLSATLVAGASSGFGLSVLSVAGQTLLIVPGVVGRQSQVLVTNTGSVAVQIVLRVSRSLGVIGSYKLALTV